MSNNVVSSTVNLNMAKIAQLNNAKTIALEKAAEAFKTEVVIAQVIPFDTGTLQNSSTYVDNSTSALGVSKLVSSTPYARRLYFHPEFNFSKAENPNAQGKWYEPFITGQYSQFAKQAFVQFYKSEGGLL